MPATYEASVYKPNLLATIRFHRGSRLISSDAFAGTKASVRVLRNAERLRFLQARRSWLAQLSDPDLSTGWPDQAGLIEFQVIHVGCNRVTDHPSVGIRPEQLVRLLHAR